MSVFLKCSGLRMERRWGTFIEHRFQEYLRSKYSIEIGNSARGIDLPSPDICTDIKTTSYVQPQSSCPFKDAKQKIWGLGYNLLLFVYKKQDVLSARVSKFDFVSCAFVSKERTGDFQMTTRLREIVDNNGNVDDISAYLFDRNLPADETTIREIAEKILKAPPPIGYLTISNALQWRLQYQRIVDLKEPVDGINKITDKTNVPE